MKLKDKKGDVFIGAVMLLIVIILILAGVIGYGMNFIKIFKCDFQSPYKCEIIRIGGFFVPIIGAVAGWTDIPDGAETKVLK